MNKLVKIIIGMIVVSAIIGAVVAFTLTSTQNADVYDLGGDQIPSVKVVLGERKGQSASSRSGSEGSEKAYVYRSETGAEDVEKYIAYLTGTEGFVPGDGAQGYVKQSKDAGKLLLVEMEENADGFALTIRKQAGVLTQE